MIYSNEVTEMCCVKQGVQHGAAPIPEEAKWVKAKEIKDISGLTHGVGWCAPQQGACKLTLNVKEGVIQEACKAKIERDRRRGIKNRPIRAMVVGIPNVGKSTFINSYAGKACAKTGNKPGVTKGKQWIRLNKTLELLDTPGILWPKFEDQEVGKRLAFIGSIKDEILNLEELSLELLDYIRTNYPGLLNTRYGIEEEGTPVSLLEAVADKRKCLIRGQEIDYAKAAGIVMEEFRNGKIGRITLEFPPVEEETAHEDHPGD